MNPRIPGSAENLIAVFGIKIKVSVRVDQSHSLSFKGTGKELPKSAQIAYDCGMKNINRRILWIALSATLATGYVTAQAQTSQAQTSAASATTGTGALAHAGAFPFDQMTVRKMPNGGESRDVLRGALATGEVIGVHESTQPAGAEPNPAHAIQHSELIMVQQGTVLFLHDGKSETVGPGGVIYVAFGTLHQLKNIGDGPAKYVVVQIGGDTKK